MQPPPQNFKVNAAATTIQRWWRAQRRRQKFREVVYQAMEYFPPVIVKIQCWWRMVLAKKLAKWLRIQRAASEYVWNIGLSIRAKATRIQRWWRIGYHWYKIQQKWLALMKEEPWDLESNLNCFDEGGTVGSGK
jgi:hypothetical protein